MRFATRKTADTTMQALVARLYVADTAPKQQAAAAALLAANPELLADLTRAPLGALIVVPDVPGVTTTADVRGPTELAAAAPAALLRAFDETVARVAADFGDDAADARSSLDCINLIALNGPGRPLPNAPNSPNWQTWLDTVLRPTAQKRHDDGVNGREGAPAKFQPLKDDLVALLARLG